MPKYPEVKVQLTGDDGNAFAILARCKKAARNAGLEPEEISQFFLEAQSDDYEHLLRVCVEWFDCE